jgi:hypothetical protein
LNEEEEQRLIRGLAATMGRDDNSGPGGDGDDGGEN